MGLNELPGIHEELIQIRQMFSELISIVADMAGKNDPDDYDYGECAAHYVEAHRENGWEVFRFDDRQTVYIRRLRKRVAVDANPRNPQAAHIHSPDVPPSAKSAD